jgi:hypothetical protein
LTDVQKPNWDKIRNEYITTTIGQRPLAAKYSISFSTLKDRANKDKWYEQRQDYRNKVATKAEQKLEVAAEQAAEEQIDRNNIHLSIWDLFSTRIREILDKNKKQVATLSGAVDVELSPDDIERLSRALDKAQRGQRLSLGLDKPSSVDDERKLEQLMSAQDGAADDPVQRQAS